jgi:ATP-dependent DNA helicase RecG
MEELPNKIRNSLGITAEVNLLQQVDKYFIEIIVPAYTMPISLHGRYYYRSGSTKQELTGAALNEFLLKRDGHTWDEVIEPRASFSDIDEKSVRIFLKYSEQAGRFPSEETSLQDLFEKLHLTEGGQLKRAAIILFGKDPGKFYPNIFTKIGCFGEGDSDILFQETEEGNLIQMLNSVLEQLLHKFLVRSISFAGINRIETNEYPVPALREMLLNALVHRDYMGAPTPSCGFILINCLCGMMVICRRDLLWKP